MTGKITEAMGDVRLSFTGEKIAKDLTVELNDILYNTLLDHLRKNSIITLQDLEQSGMPNITLRLSTIQLLFDSYYNTFQSIAKSTLNTLNTLQNISELDKFKIFASSLYGCFSSFDWDGFDSITEDEAKQRFDELNKDYHSQVNKYIYSPILRDIGARVGWSFAINLIYYAKNIIEKIPLTYAKLHELWSVFDSATDLADNIEVDLADPSDLTLSVKVHQSFLTRNRISNHHRHCPFMEGYILGILDGLYINWMKWISVEPYRLPDRYLRVRDVCETETTDTICYMQVDILDDFEGEPCSRIADAVCNCVNGSLREAVMDVRGALEEALRIAVGEKPEAQIKYSSFIKQARLLKIKFSHDRFLELYSILSKEIHNKTESHESIVNSYISEAWLLIREIPSEFSAEERLKLNGVRDKWLVTSGRRK